MQQQSGDGEQEGVSEWFQTSFGLVFWVPPALGDEKRKRKGRERERERGRQREEEGERERDREREREEDGEGERQRETERGRGRGERERCKWWAAGCFRVVSDLFLSVGYLSFGEKTGKNGKRMEKKEEKGERDREKEEVLRRWAGRCVELVSDLFWGRLWGYLVLKTTKRRGSKQIVLETHAVRKDVQRSGKASTQNVL